MLMARENACILIEGSADTLIERRNSTNNTIGKRNIMRSMNNKQLSELSSELNRESGEAS